MKILASFFDTYYYSKEFWDIFKIIPQINILLCKIRHYSEFYNFFIEESLKEADILTSNINESNYAMLIEITKLLKQSDLDIIKEYFDKYLEGFKLKYSQNLRETYIVLRKKLIVLEKSIENYDSLYT